MVFFTVKSYFHRMLWKFLKLADSCSLCRDDYNDISPDVFFQLHFWPLPNVLDVPETHRILFSSFRHLQWCIARWVSSVSSPTSTEDSGSFSKLADSCPFRREDYNDISLYVFLQLHFQPPPNVLDVSRSSWNPLFLVQAITIMYCSMGFFGIKSDFHRTL